MTEKNMDIKADYNEARNTMVIRGEGEFGMFIIPLIPSTFDEKGTTYHLLNASLCSDGELIAAQDKAL